MARFNEILSGRFNRALQKLLSMKGGPPSAQLASEITVNLQFNQMGVDFRFLEGWNRFASAGSVAAGGASNLKLRNPPQSNVIAVVESLILSSAAAQAYFLSQETGGTDFTTANGVRCLDNRPVNAGASTLGATLRSSQQTGAALTGGVIGNQSVLANTPFQWIQHEDHQLTLAPGDALIVQGIAGVVLFFTFWWRERFLEDSERT
jgi:hypothetical protein